MIWERVSSLEINGVKRVWFKPRGCNMTIVSVDSNGIEKFEVYSSGEFVTVCNSLSEASLFVMKLLNGGKK